MSPTSYQAAPPRVKSLALSVEPSRPRRPFRPASRCFALRVHDLNLRAPGSLPPQLPGCSTPRQASGGKYRPPPTASTAFSGVRPSDLLVLQQVRERAESLAAAGRRLLALLPGIQLRTLLCPLGRGDGQADLPGRVDVQDGHLHLLAQR